jgi:hypothetical protein
MRDARDRRILELKERAAHYRQLARGPMAWGVAEQLLGLAEECETEMAELLRAAAAARKASRAPSMAAGSDEPEGQRPGLRAPGAVLAEADAASRGHPALGARDDR